MKKVVILALLLLLAAGCEAEPVQPPMTHEQWLDNARAERQRLDEQQQQWKQEEAAWCEKNKGDKYAQKMCSD